ncbi:MAG TPA: T9SS type A sorting domain-containing protein [Ignavibacteria bacterium]|nr:T9SS type A sorting domain-containing protein [Ignavibacteria bacterium]
MKQIKFLVLILLTVFSFRYSVSQNTVTNTITNFIISNNITKFSFDVYSLRTSAPDFRMGSSSYFFSYTQGTFDNVQITNVNPKYTVSSSTNSYNEMDAFTYSSGKVSIQVFYNSNGPGDLISNDPGSSGLGEKIATINLDITNQNNMPDLKWNSINTAVVDPFFQSAILTNNGEFNQPLPVELSSFTSVVSGNSVDLNWSTSMEINNRGFEIERKTESTDWKKIGFVEGSSNSNISVNYVYNDRSLSKGIYNYRLKQIDFNGNFEYFDLHSEVNIGTPAAYSLSQNYPNPFNPSTKINFTIPENSKVSLKIFDISGKEVKTLINNDFRNADYYTININLGDLSSGVYFYTLTGSNFIQTKKMTLLK